MPRWPFYKSFSQTNKINERCLPISYNGWGICEVPVTNYQHHRGNMGERPQGANRISTCYMTEAQRAEARKPKVSAELVTRQILFLILCLYPLLIFF